MDKREKLEIPTIEFTPVTLLNTGASSNCDNCGNVIAKAGKEEGCELQNPM